MSVEEAEVRAGAGLAARARPVWSGLLVGLGGAIVGLLPWLRTGLRLPVQNLWAVETLSAGMPRGLLPLSQYYLVLVAALLVTGGAVAGAAGRLLGRRVRPARPAVLIGLAVGQLVAVIQPALGLHAGLEVSRRATLYLAVVVAAALASLLTGLLVAALLTARARAAAVVGVAVAAVLVPSWLGALVVPPGSVAGDGVAWLYLLLGWVAPVLVGVAIAWAGVHSTGRVVAALVALVGLWVGPAAVTAISNAAGSRVLAAYPAEMAAYAGEVFVAALTQPVLVLRSLGAAVVVAALGLTGRRLLRRTDSRSAG